VNPALVASLWVALGSALGGVGRYWVGLGVARVAGDAFPWGTLLINIIGSFVIAYFGTLTLPDGPRPAGIEMRLFVMVGLCGGFTTFSSFSFQTIELLRSGEGGRALAYIVASVVLCLAGTVLGHYVAQLGVLAATGSRP
jgi:fluoride exporter